MLANRRAPGLAVILHRWKDLAGLAGPRATVDRLLASDKGARALATGFVSGLTTTDSTG